MHFHKSRPHQGVKKKPQVGGKLMGKPLEMKEKNDNNFFIQCLLATLQTLTMKISGNGIFTNFSLISTLCDLYKGYKQSQDGGKISKIIKIMIFMKLTPPNLIHFSNK